MVWPKTSVALVLVVVACAVAVDKPQVVEVKIGAPKLPVNVIKSDSTEPSTQIPLIKSSDIVSNSTTTMVPPTTQNSNVTTTPAPSSTSTHSPNTTTTSTVPPSTSTSTTTHSPNATTTSTTVPPSTTTYSPNVTTTAVPPTPAPAPGRHWDAPSFFGGMVLAFGIVAVGFVGYRFFYLGRGGAYHTL